VERALETALGPGRVEVQRILGSRMPFGYRNQAKLVLRRTRQGVVAGLYAPGTHRVVDASACAVHHPAINRVLAVITELLSDSDITIYDERTAQGALRYCVVRYSVWLRQVQVILVSAERPPGLAGFIRALRRRCRDLKGIVLNLNADRGNVIFGSQWIPVGGRPGIVDRFGAVKLHISAGSFLQANPWIAGRLYRQAARWVGGRADDTVVDLYAGVGGIALTMAPDVRRVYAVEESELATGDCRSNARRNGISNLRALAGPAEDVVAQLRTDLNSVDVVTLNPPRTGVPPSALAAIAALQPRAMVYLSCSVDTLARDLAELQGHGYVARCIQPADMLPQTEHVECLALIESTAHST